MKVRMTGRYGEVDKLHPNGHKGIDLGLSEGTPLRSLYDGVVERVVDYGDENIGKGIIVRFADGREGIYGHLSDIKVKVGQLVSEGDVIGLSGNTGFSTGAHLHFGLKDGNGSFVDPTPLAEKLGEYSQSGWQRFLENGNVANNDYPTIKGWLYEKVIGGGIEHWIENYLISLPILVGVSIGVFALLNMVSKRLANLGVILTFILGGLVCL
ncbi:M23 family metallopeptidase [Bacillus sp. CH30_1T]|uniref:M23 family metallopeptidase n=1 Tax=Bacillus sp. CH30_1T TaxID=2604836 RepID=UPI0011ED51C8|nr:M23 family metallopeptidase [Bacillus sp. CH30_1T]KAA0565357.1 M23 family metallopeptidase [Bacillus sp. CH30_1T]